MAKLTIGGRDFDLAPLPLGRLRKAAPMLDRINAVAGSFEGVGSMEAALAPSEDMIGVLALATTREDPACDAAWLDDNASFDDVPALTQAFMDLVRESGLGPKGEAAAPTQEPEAAPAEGA